LYRLSFADAEIPDEADARQKQYDAKNPLTQARAPGRSFH
jgi:hypothetical protein